MHNFSLKNTHYEKDETIHIYKHVCGTEVIYASTKDENSVFCAMFSTLPKNDRGIPHILEHIILCGSDKYPINDPFNELVKSTLHTYLNAITYKDKTIYPLSSKNKSEFYKMSKVYLDAVFAPILSKNAFLKEGVRETESGFSGIVYNEMSSVYSDIETLIDYNVYKNLFPNSYLQFDSGGNPDDIPKATYDELLGFYNENYKKEKAILYFYGDLDHEIYNILSYIDDNYLKNLEESSNLDIFETKLENKGYKKIDVTINKEMDIYYHNISFAFERVKDNNKFYLDELSILMDFLLSSDTSILTKFLKEKYDLLDISYDFESEIEYPVLSIILKSYNPFSEDICVYEDIKHFLKEEIENGLDRDSIEGLISIENFKTIEEDFGYKAKGLSYFLDMISYYQYNADREYLHLSKNINFDYLIKQAENGYFEKLLNESIVLSKNVLECSIKAGEVLEEQLEANTDLFIDDTENENRPSDYIIPISLDEISFSKHIEFEKHFVDDIEISFVKNENEDITFLTLMFLYEDDLKDVGLFVELFSEVDTKNFTRKEIKTISDKYIGDLEVSFESITLKDGAIENYIVFEIKFLSKNIDNALDILLEIINNSVFDDTKYILSKIDEIILEYDEELVTDNIRRALLLAYKNINKKYFYKDIVSGEIFYNNLLKCKEEKSNFNNLASILQKSKTVKTYISGNEFSDLSDKVSSFLKKIEIGKSVSTFNYNDDYFETNCTKELFLEANTNTYTNVCVSKIEDYPYSGDKEVFASIIKNEYLSTEIRLNGGAYGYGMFMDYDMYFHMFSVDDPHYKRTLSVFKNTHEFIEKYAESEEIIMKNIIGTINEIENYRSFYEKYYSYVMYNIKGVHNSYLDKIKKEILSANYIKILDFSMKFNQCVESGVFLTIGKNAVK